MAAAGLVLLAGLAVTGCARPAQQRAWRQASVEHGARVVDRFACGSCHRIPGVADADGEVGPPLAGLAERTIVAGRLPNTPANLAAFLRSPQSFVGGGVMPEMGLTATEAADAAAFLLSRT